MAILITFISFAQSKKKTITGKHKPAKHDHANTYITK